MIKLRKDIKHIFSTYKSLFDKKHFDILKSKSTSVKDAEAVCAIKGVKDAELAMLSEDINSVLENLNR